MEQIPVATEPFVLSARDGGVATITLNRGDRFNPLSSTMIAALQAELDEVATNPEVRVVILAAAGRGFSAGHDLKEMRAHAVDHAWQRRLFDDCGRLMMRLTELPQPVIARVQGIATAAGCQLVSMCDLAVAADTATFALPGVNIGVFCSTPAVGVARNVGRKRAMELLLTGAPIDAPTALAWGLVNSVVPAGHLDAVKYVAEYGMAQYIATDIVPALDAMRAAGYATRTFAYPYGSRTAETDDALRPYFDHLRATDIPCP